MKAQYENLYPSENGVSVKTKTNKKNSTSKIVVVLTSLTLIVSLLYFIDNSLYHDGTVKCFSKVSFIRLASAVLIPLYIAINGLKKQSLDVSGACLGIIVAFILTTVSYTHLTLPTKA